MSEFDAAPVEEDLAEARPAQAPSVTDEASEADALEQQADVVPEEEPPVDEVLIEANPADVDEQHRVVPIGEDENEAG